MFGYYLTLALRSLKRNPLLTALMVGLIGLGVAATMTTWAALRAVSGDPVPGKSAHLFVPQIDNWGPSDLTANGEPPAALNYIDALALLHANVAARRTLTAPVRMALIPDAAAQAPILLPGYATTADFFAMFNVPFRYGGPWSSADDAGVVIGAQLNRQRFGGRNSVGRTLDLGGHPYRISGVLADWNPQPRFYAGIDVNAVTDHGQPTELFVPFARAAALHALGQSGSVMCPPNYRGAGWDALTASECDWISAWVALPTAADVQRYRSFLRGYAAEQQGLGRFHWPANVRLRNLPAWLEHMHAVPQENRIALLMAVGLQTVCLLNALALLLVKFMRRRGEIGIRRALGATRRTVATQFLIEAALIGALGGASGVLLTVLGVSRIGALFGSRVAQLAHVDSVLLGLTLLVALAATLLAASLPVWRASRVHPGLQVKAQ